MQKTLGKAVWRATLTANDNSHESFRYRQISASSGAFFLSALQFFSISALPQSPFSPPSGPATGSFNGLHTKSKFLAAMNPDKPTLSCQDAVPAADSPLRPKSTRHAFLRGAIAGLIVFLTGPLVAGTVIVDLVENGGGAGIITVTLSGSLDFVSGADSTPGFSNYINPAGGTIGFGPGTAPTQSWGGSTFTTQSTTPTAAGGAVFAPFGTGGFVNDEMTNFSGIPFYLFLNGLQVDRTYVSGAALSSFATLSGDFQSRGITAGTATTQFTLDGQANTLTVRVTSAIPEPTSIFSIAGLLGGGLLLRRRSKNSL